MLDEVVCRAQEVMEAVIGMARGKKGGLERMAKENGGEIRKLVQVCVCVSRRKGAHSSESGGKAPAPFPLPQLLEKARILMDKYSPGDTGYVKHWLGLVMSASRDKARFEELHRGIEKSVNHLVTLKSLKMTIEPQYQADMEAVVAKVRGTTWRSR